MTLDDDIVNGHLFSVLSLERFSGFTDFAFVFVHIKSKRCLPAFLSIVLRHPGYFQIYNLLRPSIKTVSI